jgi:hypothetical protein
MIEIEIEIENGRVTMEVKGTQGTRCLQLTQEIEKELGKLTHRQLTSSTQNTIHQRYAVADTEEGG